MMMFIAHYGFYVVCLYGAYLAIKGHIAWKKQVRARKLAREVFAREVARHTN